MPKAGEFDAVLQYLKNKLPQLGMFSTLDELVRAAPFEKVPAQQWQNYLKPGLALQREGVMFPLKKEELEYSGLGSLQGQSLDRNAVLDYIQQNRPEFNMHIGTQDMSAANVDRMRQTQSPERGFVLDPAKYAEHAHTPGVPGSYEESVTTSPSFGSFPSHFSPQDISWSRTTRHPADLPGSPLTRLIEEIQSDRHEAAAEKLINTGSGQVPIERANPEWLDEPGAVVRRGYQTPESQQQFLETSRMGQQNSQPPDTPFKNPEDYAGLELRKQLLNSVNQGDQYLALTRGADQVQRYEQGMGGGKGEGMSYIYDTIYPKALRKLAKQYGAEVTDVPINVKSTADVRPQTLSNHGVENTSELLQDASWPNEYLEKASALHDDLAFELGEQHPKLKEARNILTHLTNAADEGHGEVDSGSIEDLENALSWAHGDWNKKLGSIATKQKTFPAMHITPEVAERVKKAGVPLFSLAGAAALSAQGNDANANPVEDQAMQDANQGHAEGGSVFDPVKAAMTRIQAYGVGKEYGEGGPVRSSQEDAFRQQALEPSPGADQAAAQRYYDQALARGLTPLQASLLRMRAISNALPPSRGQGHAEGGSAGNDSSLAKISSFLKRYGGSDAQRLGVKVASQLYGLDEQGKPSFLGYGHYGREGEFSSQHPPGFVDTLQSLPASLIPIANLLSGKSLRKDVDNSDIPTPQWSSDAAARLAALEKQVQQTSGVGEASGFRQHAEDMLGSLITPIPIGAAGKEAPVLRRLLEAIAPVRPTTARDYALMTGIGGGAGTALDAISRRIAARQAAPALSQDSVDPQFEKASMDEANLRRTAGPQTLYDSSGRPYGYGIRPEDLQ